jgi:hypothetical protein
MQNILIRITIATHIKHANMRSSKYVSACVPLVCVKYVNMFVVSLLR